MLIEKGKSSLVIIDVQEKLVSVIPKSHKFIDNIIKLQKAANILQVPMILSEQYPKGLGRTIDKIKKNTEENSIIIEKTSFSLRDKYETKYSINQQCMRQIIICGIEAHICVLQTAIEFANASVKVYVVQDAVSSRYEKDYLEALRRLDKHPNIQIVSCEMVLFEWLRTSNHPEFKTISQLIK